MRNNCGVIAFDKLVGKLNGKANRISLDTLAKLAQDNDFILYPMCVRNDELRNLSLPLIYYFSSHFVTISSEKEIEALVKTDRDSFIVLASDLVAHALLSEKSARDIRGSGWFSKFFSKPFRTLERTFVPENKITSTILNTALGLIPGVGPLLATGYGALANSKGSDPLNVITGALAGYGLGGLGQGLGTGISKAINSGTTSELISNIGQGVSNYLSTPIIPGIAATSGSAIGKSVQNLMPSFSGGTSGAATGRALSSVAGGGSSLGGSAAAGVAGSGGLGSILSKGSMLGLGLLGISAMLPQPEYKRPKELDDLYSKLLSGESMTELGGMSNELYSDILSASFDFNDPLFQSLTSPIDQQYQEQRKAIIQQYNSTGGINSSDMQRSLAQLDEALVRTKAEYLSKMKLAAAEQATGIDRKTLEALLGITGQSITEASLQYGVQANTIQSLRSIFGTLGMDVMRNSLGLVTNENK